MKHIKTFENFLNEGKFDGKKVHPSYHYPIGAPVKSPNELVKGEEYVLYDEESDYWLFNIRYDGNSGRYEFSGPDEYDDFQYWYFSDKEMKDLLKQGHLYKEK